MDEFNIDNLDIRKVSFANWKSFDMYKFLECSEDFSDEILNMDALIRNGLDDDSLRYIKEASSFCTSILVRDYWLSTGIYCDVVTFKNEDNSNINLKCICNEDIKVHHFSVAFLGDLIHDLKYMCKLTKTSDYIQKLKQANPRIKTVYNVYKAEDSNRCVELPPLFIEKHYKGQLPTSIDLPNEEMEVERLNLEGYSLWIDDDKFYVPTIDDICNFSVAEYRKKHDSKIL